jgi:hypothetical protein
MVSKRTLTVTAKPEPHFKLFSIKHPLKIRVIQSSRMGAGRARYRHQYPGAVKRRLDNGQTRSRLILNCSIIGGVLRRRLLATSA